VTVAAALVVILLILLNGLYVAAEFAAVSVRRSRLRKMAQDGHGAAKRLLPILESPRRLDRYIACSQVGITLTSLVLGAFGQARLAAALTPVFAAWGELQTVGAQSAAAGVVLLGLTVLQMVIGELLPKSLALQLPTQVALVTLLPMQLSERALAWFIAVLNGSGSAVLRLLRVKPAGHRHIHSPEEIRYLIADSGEGGLLEPEEQVRLHRALGLTQRTARELMVPRTRIFALERSTTVDEAIRKAAEVPFTRLPVYEGSLDRVVGLVHAKDLARARFTGEGRGAIDRLIRPILAVHEQLAADRVLSLLKSKGGVMAVVVDEFGGTSGLITIGDVLAELLGEVGDEFKSGDRVPQRHPDGAVSLPGDLPLYEAPHWVGAKWEGDSDTVGGFVTERLGRIARKGDVLEIAGVRVEVEEVERNAVASVLVRPGPDPDGRRGGAE
jgi:CBS domain containing-hemolysin-like protein